MSDTLSEIIRHHHVGAFATLLAGSPGPMFAKQGALAMAERPSQHKRLGVSQVARWAIAAIVRPVARAKA